MRKTIYILSLIIVLFSINVFADNRIVDPSKKVYDYANLLSDENEKELFDKINLFKNKTKLELVIVTINENDKDSSMEYADDFYDYNFFGEFPNYSGLLILIDMDYREIYVSTSGTVIKMLSDYKIESIIDSGYNDLKNKRYFNCLDKMIDKVDYFYDTYNSLEEDFDDNDYIDDSNFIDDFKSLSKKAKMIVILRSSFITSFIISLITTLICYFKSRLKLRVQDTETYLSSDSEVSGDDRFINSRVTKVRINNDSNNGHFNGGSSHHSSHSSFHSGSSGRSHGGGGRGF